MAELVADEVLIVDQPGCADKDQTPHRVAVEAAKPRQPKQPRRADDPDVIQAHRPVVKLERIQARLGPDERGGGAGRGHPPPGPMIGGHAARMRAFWVANSASVRMPLSLSSARSLSCLTGSGAAPGAAAGAAWGAGACW